MAGSSSSWTILWCVKPTWVLSEYCFSGRIQLKQVWPLAQISSHSQLPQIAPVWCSNLERVQNLKCFSAMLHVRTCQTFRLFPGLHVNMATNFWNANDLFSELLLHPTEPTFMYPYRVSCYKKTIKLQNSPQIYYVNVCKVSTVVLHT